MRFTRSAFACGGRPAVRGLCLPLIVENRTNLWLRALSERLAGRVAVQDGAAGSCPARRHRRRNRGDPAESGGGRYPRPEIELIRAACGGGQVRENGFHGLNASSRHGAGVPKFKQLCTCRGFGNTRPHLTWQGCRKKVGKAPESGGLAIRGRITKW